MAYNSIKHVPVSDIGVPMRKRTEKACDQCRRRKTKCDGRLTCKACTEIGLECSYGHRIKQARGPQYVAHLEGRLKELENDGGRPSSLSNWQSHANESRSRRSSSASDSSTPGRRHSDVPTSMDSTPIEPNFSKSSVMKVESDEQQQFSHRRTRTTSEILSEAKDVLDSLSPTNYTARYAAECIDSLTQSLYQNNQMAAPPPQPIHDFPLFGSESFLPDFNSNQLVSDAYIDPNQTFAFPNNQLWPAENPMNFYGAPAG